MNNSDLKVDNFITPKDVCDDLGISRPTLEKIMELEGFPYIKFGPKIVRIFREEYKEWIKENKGKCLYI